MTADLVRQAQRGDHAAFEILARGAYQRLYGVARRVLRDPEAAEDAAQDAIIRAWRELRGLRDPEKFDAWLHRLLVNACRDEQRRTQRRVIEVDVAPIDVAASNDEYRRLADRDELGRAFLRLSVDHRAALVLTYYLGLTAPEVAAILRIPEGTVYSRLHYAAAAMRDILANPTASRTPSTEQIR